MNGALTPAALAVCFLTIPARAQAAPPAASAAPTPPPSPPAATAPSPAPAAPPSARPTELPPGYYVEGQEAAGGQPPAVDAPAPLEPPAPAESPEAAPPRNVIIEPPPPGLGPIVEPPPPPIARHVAPRTAIWAGLRAGWFVPFGNLYARASPPDRYGVVVLDPVRWSSYASTGLALELDVGARVARNYNVFALWERAQLGGGDAESDVHRQTSADSDFWAIAVRASSSPDDLGLITEIALGYRQARTHFDDGGALELTDGLFEGRLGVGADIRVNPWLSVSPMATLGVGSFGSVHRVLGTGVGYDDTGQYDSADSHAWFTLTVGGHVDLFPSD